MKTTPRGVYIRGTRPVANQPVMELDGIAAQLYLACDHAPTEAKLIRPFIDSGYGAREISRLIRKFLDNKFLLELDGRFVALAVHEPVAPLPGIEEYPGGFLATAAVRKRIEKRRSPTRPKLGARTIGDRL